MASLIFFVFACVVSFLVIASSSLLSPASVASTHSIFARYLLIVCAARLRSHSTVRCDEPCRFAASANFCVCAWILFVVGGMRP